MEIVFPQDNEKEFIALAEKLNIKELCLVYSLKNKDKKQEITKLQLKTKVKLKFGIIAEAKEIQKAKNISKFVITSSSTNDQQTLEKHKPNLIFNLENSLQKDKLHYRNSGLNQVLCNLAHENKTTIGFSFSEILNSKNKTRLLGRIIQNLKLCKKYKLNCILVSFAKKPFEMRNEQDLKSLLKIL